MKYKNIFFDLDDTLWDLKSNSYQSLKEIYTKHTLERFFTNFDEFVKKYHQENYKLWEQYRKRLISKDTLTSQRFMFVSDLMGVTPDYSIQLNFEYLTSISQKTILIDNTFTVLNYLHNKYKLHIITDGFFEVQVIKLKNSQLSFFFEHIISAEEIGYLKPNPQLFEYAIKITNSKIEEAIMIGDSYENDILGAHSIGMDQIFFNPHNTQEMKIKPTYTIKDLKEITNIL